MQLDAFVVMPNHVHGVLFLLPRAFSRAASHCVGAVHEPPYSDRPSRRRRSLLSKVVGYWKMNTARRVNGIRGGPRRPLWQRGFYDRVIRNDLELYQIREYIRKNPANWDHDDENPDRAEGDGDNDVLIGDPNRNDKGGS